MDSRSKSANKKQLENDCKDFFASFNTNSIQRCKVTHINMPDELQGKNSQLRNQTSRYIETKCKKTNLSLHQHTKQNTNNNEQSESSQHTTVECAEMFGLEESSNEDNFAVEFRDENAENMSENNCEQEYSNEEEDEKDIGNDIRGRATQFKFFLVALGALLQILPKYNIKPPKTHVRYCRPQLTFQFNHS